MTTKHTPGPWSIVQDAPLNPKARYNIGSRMPNGCATHVCTIKTERHLITDGKHAANAALIAAAPDLLEALQRLLAAHDADEARGILTGNTAAADQARAALAKAEGRS